MNFIVDRIASSRAKKEHRRSTGIANNCHSPESKYHGCDDMSSKRCVSLEQIPPLPLADSSTMMEIDGNRESIRSPPMVKRSSELHLPPRELPGTPSTAATVSTFDFISTLQKVERTTMEVTITVLSLDGLIAKKDEPKEKNVVLKELSSLSSHGLSLSKHGLSRLSSHGSSVRELLSRHSSHSSKAKNSSTRDGLSRHSRHSSKENVNKIKDGSMSLSSHDKRSTEGFASSSDTSSSTAKQEMATLVASFSHSVNNKDVFFTHLPSQPMELATETTLQPIAYWSAKVDLDDADQALSTLKFKRPFVKKNDRRHPSGTYNESNSAKYVPQKCPIRISVSRNGKMISLGTADIIIRGTEDGERAITSPVAFMPKSNKSKLPMNKASFPMSRVKGDYMSFGLRPDAKVRVLVHVNEPNAEVSVPSKNLISNPQYDFPIKEVMQSSMYQDSPMKDVIQRTENKTESNCTDDVSECDGGSTDEEVWEEYMVEDNELRQLRQQLVKANQQIAQSRDALQAENEKYEQFCSELEHVKMNAESTIESLREELHVARCEAVMLPVYEARISELLEELKSKDDVLKQKEVEVKEKDDEIACLREEIQEIRTGFRNQVDALSQVDSLLWDNDSQADDRSVQTNATTQSQPRTDKWLAANMMEEWSGLKNALIRNGKKLATKNESSAAASKSVKWNDLEDNSEEKKIDEAGEQSTENEDKDVDKDEIIITDESLLLIEEELTEDAAAVSDEEA